MRVVYLAGKYRAPTNYQIQLNVRRAEAVALDLWKMGVAVICPHLNTANFQGELPDNVWLAGDIEIMRRADAVFVMPGWEKSEGSVAEVELAKQLGIPVFDNYKRLEGWLRLAR